MEEMIKEANDREEKEKAIAEQERII